MALVLFAREGESRLKNSGGEIEEKADEIFQAPSEGRKKGKSKDCSFLTQRLDNAPRLIYCNVSKMSFLIGAVKRNYELSHPCPSFSLLNQLSLGQSRNAPMEIWGNRSKEGWFEAYSINRYSNNNSANFPFNLWQRRKLALPALAALLLQFLNCWFWILSSKHRKVLIQCWKKSKVKSSSKWIRKVAPSDDT